MLFRSEITGIADTSFMDVFPYFSEEATDIPANLKPLNKEETETYTNLAPGTYMLKVKAINSDGYGGDDEDTSTD